MSLKLPDGTRLPYRMSALLNKDSKEWEATIKRIKEAYSNQQIPKQKDKE